MSDAGVLYFPDVPVPVRDGTVLRANIFRPDTTAAVPALVERTPYGKAGPMSGAERYAQAGYAFISQDIRGRYASGGEWVPFSEPHTGDAEDGFDTVEWAAAQPWCNGKVGAVGASYGAWCAWMLARMQPPHLLAMAARSIPPEMTDVDWPGAFKPARRIRWWMCMMAPDLRRRRGLGPPHTPAEAKRIFDEVEHGRWLGTLPWSKVARHLPPGLAEYAEAYFTNPGRRTWRFDESWSRVTVPNFDISGWYDHCSGVRHLPGMQRHAAGERARTQSKLTLGPWSHGSLGARKQGDIDFGPDAELDKDGLIIRWFDHWLKGVPNNVNLDPPVRYFVMGSAQWKSARTWPPEGTTPATLFLHSTGVPGGIRTPGQLSPAPPAGDEPADRFRYDPDDPMPTLWTVNLFTVPADRRRIEHRSDVLFYLSEPLADDMEIAGDPEVILHAATTAPDTDFFARLIDDDPAGAALEVSYGFVRARHRRTLDVEELVKPGEVIEYHIRLTPTANRFRKGHRVRLEITSSDFPNHDRNHNVGRNDLFDTEFAVAEQTLFHSRAHPSRLVLPVNPD